MWDRYRRHLETAPLLTVEWSDPETHARGWLVINSLRGGAAGGGTRMRPDLGREEVVYLAKAMELKFAFSGPLIGGGKSGIAFDPADPRREDVLRRWFEAIRPYLATCYGTGGDVAVDEERDVVPICRDLGLAHPQEGVVRGHMGAGSAELGRALQRIRKGVSMPVTNGELGVPGGAFTVSDLITGWGVVSAAGRCLELGGEPLEGKRVIVEGFGNVGASAALYAARRGARIVGIVDAAYGLAAPDGLGAAEVEDLLVRRQGRLLPEHPLRRAGKERLAAYELPADVFIPAAISGSLGPGRLEPLARGGVRVIACGANQPFAESRLGDTRVQQAADERFSIVADVIGGLGMARAFHHFMTEGSARGAAELPRQAGHGDDGHPGHDRDGPGGTGHPGHDRDGHGDHGHPGHGRDDPGGAGHLGQSRDGYGRGAAADGPEEVFDVVRRTAEEAVERVHRAAGGPRGLLEAAVGIALER